MMYVDIADSLAAGLTFRPIGLTARDTLAFEQARPVDDSRAKPFPFTAERERAILEAWAAQNAA